MPPSYFDKLDALYAGAKSAYNDEEIFEGPDILREALNKVLSMRHIARMERARTRETFCQLLGEYHAMADFGRTSELADTLPKLSAEWRQRFHAASTRVFREPDVVEVNIKMGPEKVFPIRIDRHLPVYCLKEDIKAKEGIPVIQQRLFSQHSRLVDDRRSLSDYNIEDKSTLELRREILICACGCTEEIRVGWAAKKKEFSVEAGCEDSVETLKERIAAETGVPGEKQTLTFDGKKLDGREGKTLSEYGIRGTRARVELHVDQDSDSD